MMVRPLSHKARGRQKYQARLRVAAAEVIGEPLASSRLYAKVLYLYRGRKAVGDADNLSKPVLGALKGLVYGDDAQVALRVAGIVNLDVDEYRLARDGMGGEPLSRLIEYLTLDCSQLDVLCVEVGLLDGLRLGVGLDLWGA